MMNLRKISAKADGRLIRAYLTEHTALTPPMPEEHQGKVLATYYGRDARATWRADMAPEVAAALGIDTTAGPTEQALDRLFEAKRADTGEAWSQAPRDISAVDFVTSVEKSVSLAITFARSDEERAALLQAVWRANDRAMRYVGQELGWARRGAGGQDGAEPGQVGWVSFMHFQARPTLALQDGPDGQTYVMDVAVPGDPQVHVHNPMFNLVVTEGGHVGSLDTAEMQGRVKEFGATFQGFLANELDRLGIGTEYDKGEQAIAISCIPEEVREAFSKGHKATVHKAKRYARDQGLDWDALGVDKKLDILANTAQHTKLSKDDGPRDERSWHEQAKALGWHHETAITGERREVPPPEERIARAAAFTARHIEEEFRTAAVLDLNVVRMYAARGLIGPGIEGERDIDAVVRRVEADGITVNGERAHLIVGMSGGKERVTNTVQVALEQELSALVHRASRTQAGAVPSAAFERAVRDSGVDFGRDGGDLQLAAAERLAYGGGLVFLEGIAGVGKTKAVLPPAVLAWKAEGRRVIGISQAWRQADELKASELGEAGVHETVAISPFLDGVRDGSIGVDANTVLVIDEAAQLGPRQFLEVMRLWRDTGCTVRGMGDGEQCQSIEASSAVEIMVRNMPEEALPKLLYTVRQKSERAREIAGLFRGTELPGASPERQREHHLAEATRALDMKREDGHARLIEGDYDQVVRRIAEHYVARRDALRQAGSKRGITISALTNADAAEISIAVRAILRGRGEIAAEQAVYQAVNNRGETYDLAVAAGDRFRLYKKTAARIDGERGFIGANGDVVTVRGWWEKGLILEDKAGRIGHVEWRRITDRDTKRLLLGYGHCLTVDAAQGITSAEHINALPRGSAGITAFKGYVAESRHEQIGWTFISRAAETQAELASRPLGDPTEVTDAQLWERAAKNFAEKPYKALALDLVERSAQARDEATASHIRTDARLERARTASPDLGHGVRARVQARAVERAVRGHVTDLARAVSGREKVLMDAQASMAEAHAEMRRRLAGYLNPRRQARKQALAPTPDRGPTQPAMRV